MLLEEACARVDGIIGRMAERFQMVVCTEPNVPLYTNRIHAFARSNAHKNTQMWAVHGTLHPDQDMSAHAKGEEVDNMETEVPSTDNVEAEVASAGMEKVVPVEYTDYVALLANYDVAWTGICNTQTWVFTLLVT